LALLFSVSSPTKPEQALAIRQHAERFALLCAIHRAPNVSIPCAFGHALFAIARYFNDLALERHFLAGGEQRRPGEKQRGDQTSRVSAHSPPHLQGVFAVPVTFIVSSAGVATMPSSAYARIT
jgi:hypothetical protein